MDYKKKYKDAMERAKKWGLTHKLCIEDIFPELAESEDERIRKKLIEYHKQQLEKNRDQEIGLFHKDTLAYLEKQKEQKDYRKLYEDIAKSKWFKRAYEGKSLGELASSAAWKDEQKEQESAERIEDSVKFEEGFKTGRESGLRDGQKYVLNNLDSYGLCKPAEWSEEDELMMKAVIGILDESDHPKLCHWLKSLKPQSKQEWSEEDENARQNLIAHFEGKILKLSGEAKKEAVDWLKSLRPSWKPSEEQLEELNKVRTLNPSLDALYQQLKDM